MPVCDSQRSGDSLNLPACHRHGHPDTRSIDVLDCPPIADQNALLDLAHDAILARDGEGRITYWNLGAERTYGYRRDEAEGRRASRLLATVSPVPVAEVEATVAAAGHWEGEVTHHHRDGRPITVETRIATHRAPDGTVLGTLEIGRDVTTRKAAEAELARRAAELERSEHQLAEAEALAHLGSWEWDTQAGIVRWSAELYRIFGEDEATFVPTYENFIESVAPEDRAEVAAMIESAVAARRSYHCIYGIIRPDGERRWVETKGRALTGARSRGGFYVGTVLDVTDRHLANVALRESEAAMVEAQRVAGVGSFTFDVRTGAMWWTQEFSRIFGYPPETEASAPLVMERLHPEDLPAVVLLWDRACSRLEPWETEVRIVHSDGAVRWVRSRGEPLAGPQGEVVSLQGTVQDITERRQARDKLGFQAHLLDAVGDAVIATDLDGTILYWGPGAEKLYGWPAPEVLGRSILEVTPTVSSSSSAAEIMALLTQGKSWSGIVELQRRDGSTFLAQVADTPVLDERERMTALIGISSDVTEREAAKDRLEHLLAERTVQAKEQAAVLSLGRAALAGAAGTDVIAASVASVVETLAADRSAVFAYRADERTLVPEAVSPSAAATPSLSVAAGEGSIWPSALSDIRPVVLDALDALALFPTASFGGRGVWVTITVRHRVFGGIAISSDDPTRIFSEHDLNFLASVATVIGSVIEREELDRLKSEFVSTVSHELRTPLASVLGYLELLRSGEAGDVSADQAHMLDVIARNGNRLLALVQDLLTASRIDAGTFKLTTAPVDVSALVESSLVAIAGPRAGRALDFVCDVERDLPPVDVDAEQLERTLVNLLVNAVKFTPDGGSVTVRARRAGATVEIAIEDTGVGIPTGEQKHLFERFFRASTARHAAIQGTGLGLSIVKSIVEAHGGTVGIESEAGAGTIVTVALPVFASGPRHPGVDAQGVRARPATGMSNQKVLPRPDALATPTVPPMASASRATSANPSPLPPKRRVSVGST
ncbi:MAG TPA: PAS domain S-box protein [Acidimicrobiales bacterium]|nr:PAS domain S-box protein [Acidimicrobiales bacterium]